MRINAWALVLAVSAVICCSSCSTLSTSGNELTPDEYQRLLKKVRIFIAVAPKMKLTPISAEDKRFINTHEPVFKPDYTGPKQGVFRMIWYINPSYSIRVIGKGIFLNPSCKFRLTVSRFQQ